MKMPIARKLLAATVLFGTTTAATFAEDNSRNVDEYGFRRTPAAADSFGAEEGKVSTVYDDFGYTKKSAQPAGTSDQDVAELRSEVQHLRGLCADLYDQVNAGPRDKQDVQFVSMITRLENQGNCFEESCAPAPCAEQGCCDACNPCCEPCRCGYYAGFSAVFIKPYFKDDVAYIVDPAPDNNYVRSFDNDWNFTPRVWLGHTGQDGLGVRATYWQLDADAGPQSIVGTPTNTPIYVQVIGASTGVGRNAFAADGETFIASHSLQLQALDFEVTREWRRNQALAMAGVGLRWADMDQRYNATVLDAGGALSEQVVHTHGFEGIGPTASIFALQPFGNSGLGVYGTARGSVLFGERSQDIYEVKNGGADIGQDTFTGDEVMTIGELGFGLQYSRPLHGTFSGFIRAGYEAQIWFDAGGPTSTAGDLGLQGLLIGFGIEG